MALYKSFLHYNIADQEYLVWARWSSCTLM